MQHRHARENRSSKGAQQEFNGNNTKTYESFSCCLSARVHFVPQDSVLETKCHPSPLPHNEELNTRPDSDIPRYFTITPRLCFVQNCHLCIILKPPGASTRSDNTRNTMFFKLHVSSSTQKSNTIPENGHAETQNSKVEVDTHTLATVGQNSKPQAELHSTVYGRRRSFAGIPRKVSKKQSRNERSGWIRDSAAPDLFSRQDQRSLHEEQSSGQKANRPPLIALFPS